MSGHVFENMIPTRLRAQDASYAQEHDHISADPGSYPRRGKHYVALAASIFGVKTCLTTA